MVEFLYRAEKYGITEDENGESTLGIMEIITEKNRQGANGITKVKFIPSISTLLDTNQTFNNNSMTTGDNINSSLFSILTLPTYVSGRWRQC